MATRRTYRSSQGKSIDLGTLLLQNETVRAVGNMGVNARGDRIDNKGKSNKCTTHFYHVNANCDQFQ